MGLILHRVIRQIVVSKKLQVNIDSLKNNTEINRRILKNYKLQKMKKNVFPAIIIILIITFFLSGCFERYHYEQRGYHGNGYNHRHHQESREGRD